MPEDFPNGEGNRHPDLGNSENFKQDESKETHIKTYN